MIINKIVYGFVVQQFDTKQNKWTNQEFVTDGDSTFEYEDLTDEGDIDYTQDPADVLDDINPPDLNLDMVQP